MVKTVVHKATTWVLVGLVLAVLGVALERWLVGKNGQAATSGRGGRESTSAFTAAASKVQVTPSPDLRLVASLGSADQLEGLSAAVTNLAESQSAYPVAVAQNQGGKSQASLTAGTEVEAPERTAVIGRPFPV